MAPDAPLPSAVGVKLKSGGTATGDDCDVCHRRFSVMHYIVGRRLCGECLYREHCNAAREGRV